MPPTRSRTFTALLALLAAIGFGAGCGGGGDDSNADGGRATTIPAQCQTDPTRCG